MRYGTSIAPRAYSRNVSHAIGAALKQSGKATMKAAIRTLRHCIKKKKCDLPINVLIVGTTHNEMRDHISDAQTGRTIVLTYDKNKSNKGRSWYRGQKGCEPKLKQVGQQCDEYPFFKTEEGGPENRYLVSLRWVSGWQNMSVGGHFGFLARTMKKPKAHKDFAVITSNDLPTAAIPAGLKGNK